jgi:putative MATE family efflux protein
MSPDRVPESRFLTAPLVRLFFANALPMVLVMSMGGVLNLIDAAFLGHYVGPAALEAVSLSFPLVLVTIALSALVSGGMSSLYARHLGAGDRTAAAAVFARAHGLALCLSAGLIAATLLGAHKLFPASAGLPAQMAQRFALILICGTPLQFLLGLHADALRNEGGAGLMAMLSLVVTLANVALNYLLIVRFDLGVTGSALGTIAAQGLGLLILLALRLRAKHLLPLSCLSRAPWYGGWRAIFLLGLPLSLSFIGMALVSATVIACLALDPAQAQAASIAAYGIATRILGLAFMPIMAIALACQSIIGQNVGARRFARSDATLRLGLATALLYCLAVSISLTALRHSLGAGFSADPAVTEALARILRPLLALYTATGPVLVLALYFQAIGQPGHAALLTLVKPFLLSPPLIFALSQTWGSPALWLAFPIADSLVLCLAATLTLKLLRFGKGRAGFALRQTGDPA